MEFSPGWLTIKELIVAKHELVDLAEHLIGILGRVGWPRATYSKHPGMRFLDSELSYEKSVSEVNPRHGNKSKPPTE